MREKQLLLIIAVSAIVALSGDVVLYRLARHFYTMEAVVRLEPSGIPSFRETGPALLPRVLLLGDSRVAQWTEFAPDRVHGFNAGVSGETTAQIALRARAAIEHVQPTTIVIEAGINDLKAIPLMPERQKQIEGDCVNNLMGLVKLGREHGATVILCSVLPAGNVEWSRRPVWSAAVGQTVQAVNRRLEERCRGDTGVVFLDLTPEVQVDRDYIDTLHFNAEFYARISGRVVSAIHETSKE